MFIQTGCISGWKSENIPVTSGVMQGIAVTLRNSTSSVIRYFTTNALRVATMPAYGDLARSSPEIAVASGDEVLVAASVNSYDNGPLTPTTYQVPVAFTNWTNQGTSVAIGLKLGVATNTSPSPTTPNQVDFAQSFPGEDSVTAISRYYSSTGFISVVGSGSKILSSNVSSISLPLHASSVAGDTVLLIVMSQLPCAIPPGYTWDYYEKVLGNLPNQEPLQRNTQLSIFRKTLNAADITASSVQVSTLGS